MVTRSIAAPPEAAKPPTPPRKSRGDSQATALSPAKEPAGREKLQVLPSLDSLTGLYNRRAILCELDELMNLAIRHKEDFSLSLLDIDHFKAINDHYRHLTGDEVLARVAIVIRRNIRDTDVVGRYGGDEFLILFPRTNLSSSWAVAERLRSMIEEVQLKDPAGQALIITVSQGLVGWERDRDAASLICRAQQALYRAKEKGRNRVQILLGPILRNKP